MNLLNARVTEISMQVAGLNDHRTKTDQSIERIQKSIDTINANFIQKDDYKNFVIYKGQKFEADAASIDIYQKARKCIYIVDDYIRSGKDGVSFVLVFKLSRFGRNAADVLSSLQVMRDYGANLICVEDGIDSSKDAGKLMISVLSAVTS